MWESPTAEFANKECGEGKKTRLERAGESLRERDLQLSLSPRDCVLLVGSQSEGIVVSHFASLVFEWGESHGTSRDGESCEDFSTKEDRLCIL